MTTPPVVDISAYNNKVYVRYEDGTKKQFTYDWYFYIHNSDVDKFLKSVNSSRYNRIQKGKVYSRIYADPYFTRTEFADTLHRMGIQTYEADLPLEERFKYDTLPEISSNVNILFFDIETDDRKRKIEIGRDLILSLVAIDMNGQVTELILQDETKEAEYEFLSSIVELFSKYDIVSGWNIGGFDIPYLKARCQLHNIKFRPPGQFDLFLRCKHVYRFDPSIKSYSLNNFAKIFLNDKKVEHSESIYDMWKYDQKKLMEYNVKDVVLCIDLNNHLKITEMMLKQAQWCRILPRKFSIYHLIDSFIIQTSHKMKRPVRTNVHKLSAGDEHEPEKYMGAEVLDAAVGAHDDTYIFDFKSLYPSIMISLNIGFDTLTYNPNAENIITSPGTFYIPRADGKITPTYFYKTPSCVAESVKILMDLRSSYKKLKVSYIADGLTHTNEYKKINSDEEVVKELSNSVYGIIGMARGRYYDKDVAESITLTGRWMLRYAKEFFETNTNCLVIYGDTDSVFVKPHGEFNYVEALKEYHVHLEEKLRNEFNITESKFSLNYDKHFTRFVLFAKKTYVGHCDSIEGKDVDIIKERGIDYIKRNMFKWAADKQKELITDFVLRKIEREDIVHRIRQYKAEFYNTTFKAEDLRIMQRVNALEYKSDSIVKRLVEEIHNETGVHPIGTEISYIFVPSRGRRARAVLFDKFDGRYSREQYWEHKSRPLFDRLLEIISPGQNIDNYDLFLG